MINWHPVPAVTDAWRIASDRDIIPTALDTRGIRDEFDVAVRARAVWTARGTSAIYASKIKEVVDAVAAGDIGEAEARTVLLDTLRSLNYTPEGGFPGDEGMVPPAIAGTLQDLSSFRRRDLIIRTQLDLMRGAGMQWRGSQPDRLAAAPAWELIRLYDRDVPRIWAARWRTAGGTPVDGGRLIALKGDPVWGELGASANFDDALDTDHPPFAFNSGMGWREITRSEADRLGITGPDGISIDDFHAGAEPVQTIRGTMPRPRLSMQGVDPAMLKTFQQETSATIDADLDAEFDAIIEAEAAKAAAAYAAAA